MRILHVLLSTLYSILMATAGIAFVYLFIVSPLDWSLQSAVVVVGSIALVFAPLYKHYKTIYYGILAWYRDHNSDNIDDNSRFV